MTFFPPFRKELVLLGISPTVSYSLRPSVKEVKTPQTCQPIKTLHLTIDAFQNKNTSAQSRLGEHGPLTYHSNSELTTVLTFHDVSHVITISVAKFRTICCLKNAVAKVHFYLNLPYQQWSNDSTDLSRCFWRSSIDHTRSLAPSAAFTGLLLRYTSTFNYHSNSKVTTPTTLHDVSGVMNRPHTQFRTNAVAKVHFYPQLP